jgi:hypothetical protein
MVRALLRLLWWVLLPLQLAGAPGASVEVEVAVWRALGLVPVVPDYVAYVTEEEICGS